MSDGFDGQLWLVRQEYQPPALTSGWSRGSILSQSRVQRTCLDLIYDGNPLIHNLGEFWVPTLHFLLLFQPKNSILVKLHQFLQHSMLKSVLIGPILSVILWKSLSPERTTLSGTVQLEELRLSTVRSVAYAACETCSLRVKHDHHGLARPINLDL